MDNLELGFGDLQKARAVYRVTRDIWIGGDAWLEPHERVGVITAAAGVRSFTFLSHLGKERWDSKFISSLRNIACDIVLGKMSWLILAAARGEISGKRAVR